MKENMKNVNSKKIESRLGYTFSKIELLTQALTHSSFANEQQDMEHNERLEFLGDAVLELCISEELYKRFPLSDEGILTRMRSALVNEATLADIARNMDMAPAIRLGRGEEIQGGRERNSLLSDVLESVIAAVYLDGGLKEAQQAINLLFADLYPEQADMQVRKDYKSRLQELTQRKFQERPVYTLVGSSGPEHCKTYEVRLSLPNGQSVITKASSVKKAEQSAASKALRLLQTENRQAK